MARMELDKRGVATEELKVREQTFATASIAHDELREQHALESYTLGRMVLIFLGSPVILAGRFFLHDWGVKLGLSELDRRNYRKKYLQRWALLAAGTIFWIVILKAIL